jgi:inhibitor of KinA sporulation pathway (predicted exonuclease)
MNFLSLDLELNQPSNKIIQVGAVVGNVKTGQIFERVSLFTKLDEPLNPYIQKLCNITPEMLEQGVSLDDAGLRLMELKRSYDCAVNPITWGGGDAQLLKQQTETVFFGHRWFDVKTLYQFYALKQGLPLQGGLAKVMTRFGMKFQGTKHRADDDAYNTFLLAVKLLEKL